MKITRDDDFGGAVLNCAVRYALGRQSYMPGLVMDELRPMMPDCSERTLWCFDRDISEWLERSEPTIMNDYEDWKSFLDAVRKECKNRKGTCNESYSMVSTCDFDEDYQKNQEQEGHQ